MALRVFLSIELALIICIYPLKATQCQPESNQVVKNTRELEKRFEGIKERSWITVNDGALWRQIVELDCCNVGCNTCMTQGVFCVQLCCHVTAQTRITYECVASLLSFCCFLKCSEGLAISANFSINNALHIGNLKLARLIASSLYLHTIICRMVVFFPFSQIYKHRKWNI